MMPAPFAAISILGALAPNAVIPGRASSREPGIQGAVPDNEAVLDRVRAA
jgi:hypothetical protein